MYSNFIDRKMFLFLDCRALRNIQKHTVKFMNTYNYSKKCIRRINIFKNNVRYN